MIRIEYCIYDINIYIIILKDEAAQYTFYVNEQEIVSTLEGVLDVQKLNTEDVVEIIYQQQAVFKVRAVTRCTR